VNPQAERTLERETRRWELANPGQQSQLPEEHAAALAKLASHPYVGLHVSGHDANYRKFHLRRTGFVLLYRIRPRLRTVRIVAVVPEASLLHRR
jgi:plasmid stabilization system protein ParE